MRKIIRFAADEVLPAPPDVLAGQGMPNRDRLPERIGVLLDSAMELFAQLVDPVGIMEDVSISDFMAVYDGNGLNDPEGPVPTLIQKADRLALYAASLGSSLALKNSELFAKGKAALAFMLNAAASSGAELLSRLMGLRFLDLVPEERRRSAELRVLPYGPGHCGWHITGQAKIFQALHPEEIGITLSAGSAMEPLKSVSGVLVIGNKEIHRFKPLFPFCKDCREHKCTERIASIESDS